MGNRNVVIVDYGLGNLHSVNKAVALVGGNPVITGDKEIIAAAEKLILPGVGAFGDCMANLEKAGVIPVIKEYIAADKPFLGICLGMQVLFEESEEAPGVKGLGVFPGKVVLIPTSLKIGCVSGQGCADSYVFENSPYGLEPVEPEVCFPVTDGQ